jgi:signal recognition particle receptor subunit alpha
MEKADYFCVFSKGGIVREEVGTPPAYLIHFMRKIQLQGAPVTTKVRDSVITYMMDIHNVYLAIYRDIRMEREIIEEMERHFPERKREERERAQREKIKEDEASKREEDESSDEAVEVKKNPFYLSFFKREENLEEVEEKLSAHLVSKNVPAELSAKLAKEVAVRIREDAAAGSFEEKMERNIGRAIEQIMPVEDLQGMLRDIKAERESGKPYVFCMVGVNGVGKSTTLSKLSLWLVKKDLSLCVAACDTFRSGAIEQLRKYVGRFKDRGHKVELFERGYGGDESSVARAAIEHAKEHGFDVVLLDTSGRMHSNKDLMTSLSKLIRINKPNKIVYVGEALVGTDSLAQIKTFNEYVERAGVGRSIDGIVVTKCDTVDDKVGTIVSLSYSVGKPVLFVGVGQRNVDLLPFSIENLCRLIS